PVSSSTSDRGSAAGAGFLCFSPPTVTGEKHWGHIITCPSSSSDARIIVWHTGQANEMTLLRTTFKLAAGGVLESVRGFSDLPLSLDREGFPRVGFLPAAISAREGRTNTAGHSVQRTSVPACAGRTFCEAPHSGQGYRR